MEFLAPRHAFDRCDLGAILTHRQGEARIDPAAIDENGAGTALAAVASLLCPGQMQLLTQEVEQRHARVSKTNVPPHAVDDEADGVVHARLQSGYGRPNIVPARGSDCCEELIYGGILRLGVNIRRMPPLARGTRRREMTQSSAALARKPRADALRNRERVLEAAKMVFSGGADASLEAVARRAGVGIGTLYRHFPTREALYEAVYRREVEQLGELAEQLKNEPEPVDALRRWLSSNVEFVATKKGMSAALALAAQASPELHSYTFDRLTKALGALVDRAVAAGEIRADVGPEDLLRALVGMCYLHDQPGWQHTVLRLLDVFVDGLRLRVGQASPSKKSAARNKKRSR